MVTLLSELDVLALDCQATASDPGKGYLFEIGWGDVRAGDPDPAVEARLLRPPEGAELPRRVSRVTGLSDATLVEKGCSPEDVWPTVIRTARAIAERGRRERCPTVIHFSRYEEPYLRWLDACVRAVGVGTETADSFPLDIVCTHAIVRRLLPELPRRGLRAVAGYFGHPVGEMRRASHHVSATAAVWRASVALLEEIENVQTLDELARWLETPAGRARTARAYPMSSKIRRSVPDRPGVYKMLRGNGDVLYVGKAASLRQRIASYFQKSASHQEHILEMLSQARDLELTVTGTALEAALEESDEIKRLSPPYNKALRAEHRSLVFANQNLTSFADAPDGEQRLGPLSGNDLWTAVAAIQRAGDDVAPWRALSIPEPYAPQDATFRAGLERFHRDLGTSSLLARGAILWRESLEENVEHEFRLELQYDVGVDRWTPEAVVDRLNEIAMRAAHLVRRGHWLCLLSESTLVWDDTVLVIENGQIRSRGSTLALSTCIEKTFELRRRTFALDTYDRMIVLTREIRRLVSENRPVELHVSPRTVLTRDRLRAMLRWI